MFTPGLHTCAYETASGRRNWLNRDPIEEGGGINLYQFVYNSPLNYVDPDGLTGWALNGPQVYWDANYRNMIQSPEYQQGFKEGSADAALIGLGIASLFTPIPGDEAGIASLLGGRLAKCFKFKRKPNLPDEYWKNRKAPTQVDPGTRRVTDMKPSSRKQGETYERTTHYDEFGRSKGQTHRTDHGQPDIHPNPHHHTRNPKTGQESGPLPGTHPEY